MTLPPLSPLDFIGFISNFEAAIALYAQRWAEDCLANTLAVLNSHQASVASGGSDTMEAESAEGGLGSIPRAWADPDTFGDEATVRAILAPCANNPAVAGVLIDIYCDQNEVHTR
jgi:hypothetical protein